MQEENTQEKHSKNKYKTAFFVISIIAILEACWIYLSSDLTKSILMPNYMLSDNTEGIVVATGSWISTTELAYPIQTVEIDCWKDFGHCWITDASLSDEKYFSINSDIEEIAKWTDDAIETVPSVTSGGCVEYFYRIDRRSKTVTATRRTVDNKTELCKGIQEEPIIMHLGDGFDRIDQ